MKTWKKVLIGSVVLLVIVVTLVVMLVVYLWTADPFNIRALLNQSEGVLSEIPASVEEVIPMVATALLPTTTPATTSTTTPATATETLTTVPTTTPETESEQTVLPITPEQASMLSSVGIDPNSLLNLTAAQLECFNNLFGVARVEEIKGGAVPSALELWQARTCL